MTRQSTARRARRGARRTATTHVRAFAQSRLSYADQARPPDPPGLVYAAYLDCCEQHRIAPMRDAHVYAELRNLGHASTRVRDAFRIAALARVEAAAASLGKTADDPLPRRRLSLREQQGKRPVHGDDDPS